MTESKSMRLNLYCLLGAILAVLAARAGAAEDSADFDWEAWRALPVQDGGRYKPLDTLAGETARLLGDRACFVDPQTGRKLSSLELYLTLLLTGKEESPPGALEGGFLQIPQPDAWDAALLLSVGDASLRKALGLPENEKCVSPLTLSKATFRDATTGGETPFLREVRKLLAHQQQRPLTPMEQKTLQLADAFGTYQELRRGNLIHFVPRSGDDAQEWMSAGQLLRNKFENADDPSGLLREAQTEYRRVQAAFRSGSVEDFNAASAMFFQTLKKLGGQVPDYPAQGVIALEVAYNHWIPFRWAWICTGGALVLSLWGWRRNRRFVQGAAGAAFAAGLLAILVGLAMRAKISGWAPITNMYESMIFTALGSSLFGLIFGVFYRRRYVLTAAAAVSTLALILADNCPQVLDPSIHPLTPVLRTNYWLVIHVMSIMLGYVAFALAWALGNIALGYYLFRRDYRDAVAVLNKMIYPILQVGVLLLAIGTILGGVWAEYAWGRFWGWDPKEVWALITLLIYLALLHARRIGWVGDLGLAARSVTCFALIVVWAWYGVNFVQGTGLHSYGFGSGGALYVLAAVLLQEGYVEAAVLRGSLSQTGTSTGMSGSSTGD